MATQRFLDRRVIVTGGASGIGEAITRAFAVEGADVIVADLEQDRAERIAASLSRAGGNVRAFRVDVADEADVRALMTETAGRLDVLICAAGLFFGGTAESTSLADWRRVTDVNLTGTFLCAKAAVPLMRANDGGSIVTIASSTGAHDALPGAVAYVASKGGVTMLTKALAVDHAAERIRVNSIAPGPTDTPMLRGLMSENERQELAATLPVKRLGRADELAAAALFLASDEASFITGAVLAVDGGQTALV